MDFPGRCWTIDRCARGWHHSGAYLRVAGDVGYGRFKQLMDDIEKQAPGFFFAGHYRDGISLGDSIMSGHNSVRRIEDFLTPSASMRQTQRAEITVSA